MGVHGLTSYLRENRRQLSKTTTLSSTSEKATPLIVDGWSFIYSLYHTSGIPWVYGGEYPEFSRLVTSVVESWIKVGLSVYFVFDGACPDLKFPTLISRLTQSRVQPSQLFFRTSAASRSTNRFLNETRILPPLAYTTCIFALDTLRQRSGRLFLHFADEEGDPYAVELAARLGGYVLGNDSDFVILNSEGYKGYIPLDEFTWQVPVSEDVIDDDDENDFQTVRRSKAKRRVNPGSREAGSLVPPPNLDEATLTIVSYTPEALATHLNVPSSLLPLLAALVGNDYSKESELNSKKFHYLFFDRHSTPSQRIDRVASTIHSVLSPGSNKKKSTHKFGSVMDLIDRTVNALLTAAGHSLPSRDIEEVIEKIVNATLQYAIPRYEANSVDRKKLWATRVCALHDPDVCPFLPMISHNVMRQTEEFSQTDPRLLEVREQYLDAYRAGAFSHKCMDILSTGSVWGRLFLENPDLETVGRSIGGPIRQWIFTILHDAVGLPTVEEPPAASQPSEGAGSEESDEDEIIDVVESDSDDERDFLAPLKGELQRLQSVASDGEDSEAPLSIISHRSQLQAPTIVTEYLRRGTRIAPEKVVVRSLDDSLESIQLSDYGTEESPPLVLRSEEDRLTLFLRILQSDFPVVGQLPPDAISAVVALRWVVLTLHSRFQETGSKDREKERWSIREAKCVLAALSQTKMTAEGEGVEAPLSEAMPSIQDRNIQLTAQILTALEEIEQLSQVLLLTKRIGAGHHFSGRTLHRILTTQGPPDVPDSLWEAVKLECGDAFQPEQARKKKFHKGPKTPAPPIVRSTKTNGLFALLGDMDA